MVRVRYKILLVAWDWRGLHHREGEYFEKKTQKGKKYFPEKREGLFEVDKTFFLLLFMIFNS